MVKRKTQRRTVTPVLRRGTYTADHVIDKLIDAIKQEPGRLRMRWWISFLRGENLRVACVQLGGQLLSGRKQAVPRNIPACGTVACAAGWINIITRNMDSGRDGTSALNKLLGRGYGKRNSQATATPPHFAQKCTPCSCKPTGAPRASLRSFDGFR